jgi:phage-related minor tail protein
MSKIDDFIEEVRGINQKLDHISNRLDLMDVTVKGILYLLGGVSVIGLGWLGFFFF